MKRTVDERIAAGFNHAVNFYNSHPNRTVDEQWKCLAEMQKITGYDDEICAKIQSPILSLLMYQDTVNIANEAVQHQLRIVTDLLRNRLLDLKPKMQPDVMQELPYIPKVPSKPAIVSSLEQIVTEQIPSDGVYQLVNFSNKDLGYKGVEQLLYSDKGLKAIRDGSSNLSDIYQGMAAKQGVMIVQLNLSNCNIGGLGADKLGQAIHNDSGLHSLQYLNLSNNNIDDSGIYSLASNARGNSTPSLRWLDLSNNLLTDNGANSFYWAFKQNKLYYLNHLDVSGNKITQKGATKIVQALNSDHTAKGAVIILEKQSSLSGVKSFMKKAFTYYAGEIKKYLDNQQKTNEEVAKIALKVYGNDDWAHCKKFVSEGGVAVGMGVSSKMAHPITRMLMKAPNPYVKAAVFGGIVIDASIESMGSVDWKDAGYCVSAINGLFSSSQDDPLLPDNSIGFIGENGVIDEIL